MINIDKQYPGMHFLDKLDEQRYEDIDIYTYTYTNKPQDLQFLETIYFIYDVKFCKQ